MPKADETSIHERIKRKIEELREEVKATGGENPATKRLMEEIIIDLERLSG